MLLHGSCSKGSNSRLQIIKLQLPLQIHLNRQKCPNTAALLRQHFIPLLTKCPLLVFQKKNEGRREKGSWMRKARKMKMIESPPEAKM